MKEADYSRVTYRYTMAAAEILSRLNPGMTFIFVSGSGTDSSEKGRAMWARVKGRTENALLKLPLKAYMFRPGFIEPMDGIQSKTPMYRRFYTVLGPLFPILRKNVPEPGTLYPPARPGHAQRRAPGYAKHVLEARISARQRPAGFQGNRLALSGGYLRIDRSFRFVTRWLRNGPS